MAVTAWGHARAFALVGHKWFCSAPMSDGFLTLAHTEVRPHILDTTTADGAHKS